MTQKSRWHLYSSFPFVPAPLRNVAVVTKWLLPVFQEPRHWSLVFLPRFSQKYYEENRDGKQNVFGWFSSAAYQELCYLTRKAGV